MNPVSNNYRAHGAGTRLSDEKGAEIQLPVYLDSFWLIEIESEKR